MKNSNSEQRVDGDLEDALRLAILAILSAASACTARLDPKQLVEVKERIGAGTSQMALYVTTSGAQVHAELALVDPKAAQTVFTQAMLTLDGPILSAFVRAGAATVVNRSAMN